MLTFLLPPLRATWGVRECAAFLGISTREVCRLMAAGRFPEPARGLTLLGRRRLWVAADVRDWLEAQRPKPTQEQATA